MRIQAIGRKTWEFFGECRCGPASGGVIHDLGGNKASSPGAVGVSSGRFAALEHGRDGTGAVAAGPVRCESPRACAAAPSRRVAAKSDSTKGKAPAASCARRQESVRATDTVVERGSTVRTDGWPLDARPADRCTRLVGPCPNLLRKTPIARGYIFRGVGHPCPNERGSFPSEKKTSPLIFHTSERTGSGDTHPAAHVTCNGVDQTKSSGRNRVDHEQPSLRSNRDTQAGREAVADSPYRYNARERRSQSDNCTRNRREGVVWRRRRIKLGRDGNGRANKRERCGRTEECRDGRNSAVARYRERLIEIDPRPASEVKGRSERGRRLRRVSEADKYASTRQAASN